MAYTNALSRKTVHDTSVSQKSASYEKAKPDNSQNTSYLKVSCIALLLLNPAAAFLTTQSQGKSLLSINHQNLQISKAELPVMAVSKAAASNQETCSANLLNLFAFSSEPSFFHKFFLGLPHAILKGQIDYVKWYLANNYQCSMLESPAWHKNKEDNTPVYLAVKSKNVDMLKLFIQLKRNGFDVDLDEGNVPALCEAAAQAMETGDEFFFYAVRVLLEEGADPDRATKDTYYHAGRLLMYTPKRAIDIISYYMAASESYQIDRKKGFALLHLLLQHKPSLSYGPCKCLNDYMGTAIPGYTPVAMAALFSDHELAEVLLEAGAKPDSWMSAQLAGGFVKNITPLYFAVYKEDAEMVRLLLKDGADADAPSENTVFPDFPTAHKLGTRELEKPSAKYLEIKKLLLSKKPSKTEIKQEIKAFAEKTVKTDPSHKQKKVKKSNVDDKPIKSKKTAK